MKNTKTKRTIFMMVLSAFMTSAVLFTAGCNTDENAKVDDTPTSGEMTITVDETFAPIMESEVNTFQQIYKYAKIHVKYKPEAEVMNDLLSDSSRLVIVARGLNKDEQEYFRKLEIVPTVRKIGYDAIAAVVNNGNRDTLLTFEILKQILTGQITSWKQINPASPLGQIQVVFDNANSSTARYMKEQINTEFSKNSYAVKTNKAVIDYVSKNRSAIGILGVSWISDLDDNNTTTFLNQVKVVGFKSNSPTADPNEYYQPYQAYIAQKFYPMMREINMITREARAGLASGFIAFVTSERGQRIILKSGLVPATAPIRLIEVRNEDIFTNEK